MSVERFGADAVRTEWLGSRRSDLGRAVGVVGVPCDLLVAVAVAVSRSDVTSH
jgi:hypothetical protein